MVITGIKVLGSLQALPGEKVVLTYGQSLLVNVSFDYRGAAQKVMLYGAIGVRAPAAFEEKVVGWAEVDLPDSPTKFTCPASVEIPIIADITPGTDYDLYCKINEYPGAGMPEVDDVIDIVGVPPTYELIQHTIYHFAYIYDGPVEVVTATFKTDPFTPSAWAAQKFADALESEVRKEGGMVLEVKAYVDTSPLLWTNFRIEVINTPLGGAVEAAPGIGVAGIPIAVGVLIIALSIIAVIVVATLMWERFQDTFKPYPYLKEMKPAWGKEALIIDIQDAEKYWERPLTPVETLEGMSEEELRDHLDQIAEEEVTPEEEFPWELALIGGLGVLGVGAVAAFAMAKPKE